MAGRHKSRKRETSTARRVLQNLAVWWRFTRVVRNWPMHYWWKWTRPDRAVYRMRGGVRLKLRPGTHDKLAMKEVWVHNLYFPAGFELRDDETVIDIGAHVGTFALKIAGMVPRGRVIAFEPEPANFELLEENILLNGCTNVELHQEAVGPSAGRVAFYQTPRITVGHSMIEPAAGKVRKIEVDSVTLEQVMERAGERAIGYLKIDCEGAEHGLLRAAPQSCLERIRRICVETDPVDDNRTPEKLGAFLEEAGFQIDQAMAPHGGTMLYGRREGV